MDRNLMARISADANGAGFKDIFKKVLKENNQSLLNQINHNKKYIGALQNLLVWLMNNSRSISPEYTSLILMDNESIECYDYELKLLNPLSQFICKNKYFSFNIDLVSTSGDLLPLSEIIPIEIKLYTSDEFPKQISTTLQGKPIIKYKGKNLIGYQLERFTCRVKMQITEVSSHCVNGTVHLVICKKDSVARSIKPLVIKNLTVKAKETKSLKWGKLPPIDFTLN